MRLGGGSLGLRLLGGRCTGGVHMLGASPETARSSIAGRGVVSPSKAGKDGAVDLAHPPGPDRGRDAGVSQDLADQSMSPRRE